MTHYYGDTCPGGHGAAGLAGVDLDDQLTPQEADAQDERVRTAVETLTAAADRLDALLAGCTAGPWERRDTSTLYMNGRGAYNIHQTGEPGIKLTLTAFPAEADLIVALVNAGPALVAWLRNAAREADQIGPNPQAVALARVVMGER